MDRNPGWCDTAPPLPVALLTEGVDRNSPTTYSCAGPKDVALLTEGVDRNSKAYADYALRSNVALLTEGVDRNVLSGGIAAWGKGSPSSRRAWIEIAIQCAPCQLIMSPSSRRAWIEILRCQAKSLPELSPSSRRAWIEIAPSPHRGRRATVALLTEGVDRNALFTSSCASSTVALLTEGVDRNLTSSLRH